jgi:hypothetical protein
MLKQAQQEMVEWAGAHLAGNPRRRLFFIEQYQHWHQNVLAAATCDDAWEAAYWGLRLGARVAEFTRWDHDDAFEREQKRVRGKRAQVDASKAAVRTNASEAADCVELLVNKKGLDVTAAQAQVAKEFGKSLRTIQRWCKASRHS